MSRIDRLSDRGRIVLSTSSRSVGNLVVALIAVGILRITTHELGSAQYGLFALVLTYVNLFSLIADLGITAMTTRELSRADADKRAVLGTAMSSRVVLSIMAIPIILGTAHLLYPNQGGQFKVAMAVMSLDVLLTTVQTTAGTAFAAAVRGEVLAWFNLANRLLYLAGVIAVVLVRGSYLGYVCAYVGADLVMAAVFLVAARRLVPFRWVMDLRAWWRGLAGAFPLGVIQLIGNVYSWADSILLSVLTTSTQLGYYSVAFNVVNVLGSVPSFLMQSLVPSLVNADAEEVAHLVNRATYILFCIGAPLAVGGIVLSRDIVLVLAGAHFLPSTVPLAILAVTLPVSFLQVTLGYTSVAIDRYRPLLLVGLGALAVNIAVNLVLIPRFGPIGAASTLLGSEVVSLVTTYLVFRHLSGVHIRWFTLWRPTVAAGMVLGLAAARDQMWAGLNHVVGLLVGSTLVVGLYVLGLWVLGGVPVELRGRAGLIE